MNHSFLIDAIYGLVFAVALATVVHDVWLGFRQHAFSASADAAHPIRWRTGVAMVTLAWLPLVIAIVSGGL